jgi:hypothetical protein
MNYSSTLLLLSLFRTCNAFAPAAQGTLASIHTLSQRSYTGPTSTSTTTSLDLIPRQGNQLVAAFNAGTTTTTTTNTTTSSAQRKQEIATTPFLQRLLIQIHFQQRPRYGWSDGFPFSSTSPYTKKNGKALYYPLVGFQFISSPEGKTCTLPTTSNASCRIHSTSAEREEDFYGCFTTSFCPLNWAAYDICREPIIRN